MKRSKIYTKSGDSGQTGLVSGNRTSKADRRIDLYGELDELNSRLGVSCSYLESEAIFEAQLNFLRLIQSAIFDLGSNLACEAEHWEKYKLPQLGDDFIAEIEKEIDQLDSQLEPLKNFILPGGSVAASSLHLCRTCTRSVERKLVSFREETKEAIPENSLIFLNRMSDYFFVLSRYVNKVQKKEEIAWKPRH
jgi:cob(I)alamin adenosyltransferase